eukprot:810794-Prorocentrum_lima.AAC.1
MVSSNHAVMELDNVYKMLSDVAGYKIDRPAAANAYLKFIGLPLLARRFSSLTSRRHQAAHPDTFFVEELWSSLTELDPTLLEQLSCKFKCKSNCNSYGPC